MTGTETKTAILTFPPTPTANFTIEVDSLIITVDATASSSEGIIDKYVWLWGDGKSDTVTTAVTSHTYTAPGIYLVNLKVTDDNVAESSLFEKPVSVHVDKDGASAGCWKTEYTLSRKSKGDSVKGVSSNFFVTKVLSKDGTIRSRRFYSKSNYIN